MSGWKKVRICLDWVIKLALIVGLVFCFTLIKNQNQTIESQSQTIVELQINAVAQNEVLTSLAGSTDGYNSQFATIAEVLKENEANKIDKDALIGEVLSNVDAPSKEDVAKLNELLSQQVTHITNQLQELKENDKATISQLETVVSNALISLSKPVPTVVKPMPNVQPVVTTVAISNAQKASLVKQVKGEIYVDFEKAGYGDFEDGEFLLKEPFFGAILDPDKEWKFEPIGE